MGKLKKELSLFDVFSLACGTMISSGIFVLSGIAFGKVGPAVFVSYFIAGIIALIGILSIVELSTAMPKAGGDYFFITRSLGPMAGTVSGVLSWVALSLKSAFAVFGLAGIINLYTGLDILTIGIFVTLAFVFLNAIGVRVASNVEVVLFVVLVGLLFYYLIAGMPNIKIAHYEPFLPKGFNAMFSTAGFVFISYGGLVKIASISEEVKNPKQNIPIAFISSVIFVTLLYALVMFVTVGVLDGEKLANTYTPIADAASVFKGPTGYFLMTLAAVLAFMTTALMGIMAASRYPLALSRDFLFPEFMGQVHKRTKTPIYAILATGLLVIVVLFLNIDLLVKAASTAILTVNLLSNVAVIILRESKIQNYRPTFRVPLYPYLPIVGIIMFAFLIIDMGSQAIELSLFFILGALLIYKFYGSRGIQKEYALLHLVGRVTNKEITSEDLENELIDILHERDDVTLDRFDHLLKNATILDLEGPLSVSDFFKIASEVLSEKVSLESEEIMAFLEKREKESSTAITPFLAIPHIIIPGQKLFSLMIVRCKEGIAFSKTHEHVKTVFLLLGTKDERNFHLQALSSIAQIVQGKNFEHRWMNAKAEKNLRDILLLSERKRFA